MVVERRKVIEENGPGNRDENENETNVRKELCHPPD